MAQLQAGKYTATITNVEGKDYGKFMKVLITCDIITDIKKYNETGKSPLITKIYYGNKDFTRDYFNQVGLTSESAIGKTVQVVIQKETFKNKEGELVTNSMIKYLNFIDENNNPIISNKVLEKINESNKNKKLDF